MYQLATLDGDYLIEVFERLADAQAHAWKLIDAGVLVGVSIYLDGRLLKVVSLY